MYSNAHFTQTFLESVEREEVWNEVYRLFIEDRDCVLFMIVRRDDTSGKQIYMETKSRDQIVHARSPSSEPLIMRLQKNLIEDLDRRRRGDLIVVLVEMDEKNATAYPCIGIATRAALGRGG